MVTQLHSVLKPFLLRRYDRQFLFLSGFDNILYFSFLLMSSSYCNIIAFISLPRSQFEVGSGEGPFAKEGNKDLRWSQQDATQLVHQGWFWTGFV